MRREFGLRGNTLLLIAGLVIALACSVISPSPNTQPTFDPTKITLELQSTAVAGQLTQAAVNPNSQSSPIPTVQREVQATAPQATVPAPTPTAPAQQKFFTEDFNIDVANWTTFLTSGKIGELEQRVENGFWVFDLSGREIYAYSIYQPEVYEDVRIDVRAENRGDNTNNISIICRYDQEEGWFEFNMYNSGLYNIYYGRWKPSGTQATYLLIADGGSNAIHQGKAFNDYSVICKGNTQSLFINGDEVQTITQDMYRLRQGQIGIGVSSFDRLPVLVGIDSVTISEP